MPMDCSLYQKMEHWSINKTRKWPKIRFYRLLMIGRTVKPNDIWKAQMCN